MAQDPDSPAYRKVKKLQAQTDEMARTLVNTADRYVETHARIPTNDRTYAFEEAASQFATVPLRARRKRTGCCVIL